MNKADRIKQFIWILLFLKLVIIGCESKEKSHLRNVVNECLPIIKECTKNQGSEPKIIGKIVVWNVNTNTFSSLREGLPSPGISDKHITVVFILKKNRESVGVYGTTKLIGYRENLEYCLIYWPEKVPGGKFTVSDDPPQRRTERTASTQGNAEAKLMAKLEELMK